MRQQALLLAVVGLAGLEASAAVAAAKLPPPSPMTSDPARIESFLNDPKTTKLGVFHRDGLEWEHKRLTLVTGTRLPDGACMVNLVSDSANPETNFGSALEIAKNPDTCESLYEMGRLTDRSAESVRDALRQPPRTTPLSNPQAVPAQNDSGPAY